jgi:hypothetical protein
MGTRGLASGDIPFDTKGLWRVQQPGFVNQKRQRLITQPGAGKRSGQAILRPVGMGLRKQQRGIFHN